MARVLVPERSPGVGPDRTGYAVWRFVFSLVHALPGSLAVIEKRSLVPRMGELAMSASVVNQCSGSGIPGC